MRNMYKIWEFVDKNEKYVEHKHKELKVSSVSFQNVSL